MSLLAVTGATGFVGGHLLDAALAAGHRVRALTRRPQPSREGIEWVAGTLEDADALARLCAGADAAIHVAGAINAPTREGFAAANIAGTERVLDAAVRQGVARFVHVSSLAAREPGLSAYGWSKAESERVVREGPLPWAIVRPPAVYGPGDRETLELFQWAARGLVLLPPGARLSVVHAHDLARLLLACATDPAAAGLVIEPDDGRPGGWRGPDFARALGTAVGRPVLPVETPAPLLHLAGWIDRRTRGAAAKLSADRVRYFLHPDWVVSPAAQAPPSLWTPQVETAAGLRDTAAWYRAKGWLKPA